MIEGRNMPLANLKRSLKCKLQRRKCFIAMVYLETLSHWHIHALACGSCKEKVQVHWTNRDPSSLDARSTSWEVSVKEQIVAFNSLPNKSRQPSDGINIFVGEKGDNLVVNDPDKSEHSTQP